MKKLKFMLVVLLSLTMVMTAFAGCAASADNADASQTPVTTENVESPTTSEEEPTEAVLSGTIKFVTNRTDLDQDGTYEQYIAKFQEQYPDASIEIESITDYAGEMATRMQTEEYGDVLMIPDAVPASSYADYFEPWGTVEDVASERGYLEGYLYTDWYDGQVYGLPYMNMVQGVIYNKAVFEEAGIAELPKTPEEFLNCLQQIKDNTDAIPYYTNANSGWPLDQFEDHCWGSLTGDPDYHNNGIASDKGAFSEGSSHYTAAKVVYDIISKGLCEDDPTTCDWEGSKPMLNNGEIGCMVLGNWAINQMKEAGDHPDDVGYMPFPFSIDGKQYATSGGDYSYAINVHSENKELAKAWVYFLIEESGLCLSQGGISLVATDPMPEGLEEFASVQFVVDHPATNENMGKLSEVEAESGIALYDNGVRMNRVVDAARGASSETFEEIMADLNQRWSDAIDAVG